MGLSHALSRFGGPNLFRELGSCMDPIEDQLNLVILWGNNTKIVLWFEYSTFSALSYTFIIKFTNPITYTIYNYDGIR